MNLESRRKLLARLTGLATIPSAASPQAQRLLHSVLDGQARERAGFADGDLNAIISKTSPLCSSLFFTAAFYCRDVAQPGRALAWGARGRQFKSARPDQFNPCKFAAFVPLPCSPCGSMATQIILHLQAAHSTTQASADMALGQKKK
jgi:hypothetical protein